MFVTRTVGPQSIDFGSYRWGESHSPCFIFSLNCSENLSRAIIATLSTAFQTGRNVGYLPT